MRRNTTIAILLMITGGVPILKASSDVIVMGTRSFVALMQNRGGGYGTLRARVDQVVRLYANGTIAQEVGIQDLDNSNDPKVTQNSSAMVSDLDPTSVKVHNAEVMAGVVLPQLGQVWEVEVYCKSVAYKCVSNERSNAAESHESESVAWWATYFENQAAAQTFAAALVDEIRSRQAR